MLSENHFPCVFFLLTFCWLQRLLEPPRATLRVMRRTDGALLLLLDGSISSCLYLSSGCFTIVSWCVLNSLLKPSKCHPDGADLGSQVTPKSIFWCLAALCEPSNVYRRNVYSSLQVGHHGDRLHPTLPSPSFCLSSHRSARSLIGASPKPPQSGLISETGPMSSLLTPSI